MQKNITIVKIGYNHLGFEDQSDAMQLFNLLGRAVQLSNSTYSLPAEYKHFDYCLTDAELPELKLVPASKVCGHHTVEELKQMVKDREDMEQQMKQIHVLAAPESEEFKPSEQPYEPKPDEPIPF